MERRGSSRDCSLRRNPSDSCRLSRQDQTAELERRRHKLRFERRGKYRLACCVGGLDDGHESESVVVEPTPRFKKRHRSMRIALYSTSVVACFLLPSLAACQGKGEQKPAGNTGHPTAYHISDKLSVIDNGDTITWIMTRPNMTKPDTAVFVFKGESAMRVRPAPATPVSPADAAKIKRIRDQLKQIRMMDADFEKFSK